MKMCIGGFGFTKNMSDILGSGFDFAELDMPELEEMSDSEFAALRDICAQQGLKAYVGARVLPVAKPLIFCEGFSCLEWRPYLERSCKRSAQMGIRKFVFGNGKARNLPEERRADSDELFVAFMRMMSEIAGENDLELLLEPLGPRYSNYINTLPEAGEIAGKVDMPNFNIMADIRHMFGSSEPFSDLILCAERVRHIHIDCPCVYPQRPFPRLDDGYDYSSFFAALMASGYSGTLTVEADIPEDWAAAASAAFELLKAYDIEAGARVYG